MSIQLQLVDLRDEIAEYERKYRPFPPRPGSVSKPARRSMEPETDSGFKHVKFAKHGAGKQVGYVFPAGRPEAGRWDVA